MLSTLMRYDFKRLFKWVLPCCGLILLSAGLFDLIRWRIANPSQLEEHLFVPYTLLSFVLMLGIFAGCLAAFAVICNHFYKNLMTDEGYLTFTLPVTPNQILASKLIAGSVCMLLISLFAIVGIYLLSIGFSFGEVAGEITAPDSVESSSYYFSVILSALLYGLTSLVSSVMQIYFAIVMGCTVAKNHKVAASIGFWYLTGIVTNIITSFFNVGYSSIYSFSTTNVSADFLLMAIINVLLCVGMYFWSLQRLKNKLNLQ